MVEKKPTSKRPSASTKKQPVSDAAVERGDEVEGEQTKARAWSIDSIFWGLLFVAIGSLLLLGNFGVVEVQWGELWQLWPLLVIAAGFSVLSVTHWIWKLVSVMFVVASICLVILVGTGQYEFGESEPTKQAAVVETARGVTRAELELQAGASEIEINSDDMPQVIKTKFESDGLRLEERSSRRGNTQKVVLSTDTRKNSWFGPWQNDWSVVLSERLPISLTIDAGASSIEADLSKVQLERLSLQAGASSSEVTVGSRSDNLDIDVDAGVSSTTLRIPEASGVTLKLDGGLSSHDLEGLEKIKEGEYRSGNYRTAQKRVTITADAGLASFTIERY